MDDGAEIEAEVDRFVAEVMGRLLLTPTTTSTSTTTTTATATTTAGTGTSTTGGAVTTTSTSLATTTTLPSNVSFAGQVQPIFTASCALTGCHAGRTPAEGLKLTAGRAYAALVNVQSTECPAFKRVAPGAPDASYVVFKLHGAGPCFLGGQMPFGQPPLSPGDQATISGWIAEGAPNN